MREIRLSGSGEGAVLSRPYLINLASRAATTTNGRVLANDLQIPLS